jgi:hypothetical protein
LYRPRVTAENVEVRSRTSCFAAATGLSSAAPELRDELPWPGPPGLDVAEPDLAGLDEVEVAELDLAELPAGSVSAAG